MKKVININFQGRVIPIEETAYEILQQYIDSLRKYFANEEGRDEIINDIEGRIAELFSDQLKKGSTCITDADVNNVIASMGRPSDFEQADTDTTTGATTASANQQSSTYQYYTEPIEPRRLYRSENDKILGGVCAGLANYLRIDPAIVRIIFALITFGGFGVGFLIYILLWIVLPARNQATTVRKRLYRNPEDRVIGGVASGLAAYFKIDVWIPRLIFALPVILSVISSIFRNAWFDFDPTPVFIFGGFGGTLFVTYIILWLVLPQASSASEKLEMRGERVDLESIKNTVKEDLQHFKTKAQQWGAEVKETAQNLANQAGPSARAFTAETVPVARRVGSGIGHAIGVLFKAFFLFIAGLIAFALMMMLIGLLMGGFTFFPLKDFVLDGFWQNALAWGTLILFLGVPVIGLCTWLIRRIIGVRSRSPYLGYVFGTLWTLGWVSVICLTALIVRNFKYQSNIKEEVSLTQPTPGKLLVKVGNERVKYYGGEWFGIEDDDFPFYTIGPDSIHMNTVRVRIVKSADSNFHVYKVRFSRGNNPGTAEAKAGRINFSTSQTDSMLILPKGFTVSKNEKFRNQQVLVVVEVPVGKKIMIDGNIDQYDWFDIDLSGRRKHSMDWNDNWDESYWWDSDIEYIMTNSGLEKVDKPEVTVDSQGRVKTKMKVNGKDVELERDADGQYRYNQPDQPATKDTNQKKRDTTKSESEEDAFENDGMEMGSPIRFLARILR